MIPNGMPYLYRGCAAASATCPLRAAICQKLNSFTCPGVLTLVLYSMHLVVAVVGGGIVFRYAFVEFENQESAEEAYFKMDNALIDDRRIHVDFSQSVAKANYKVPKRYGGGAGGALPSNMAIKDQSTRRGAAANYEMLFDEEVVEPPSTSGGGGGHASGRSGGGAGSKSDDRGRDRDRDRRSDRERDRDRDRGGDRDRSRRDDRDRDRDRRDKHRDKGRDRDRDREKGRDRDRDRERRGDRDRDRRRSRSPAHHRR